MTVSLLKTAFLKIILLHQKQKYQSDSIWSELESDLTRSPILSKWSNPGFADGHQRLFKSALLDVLLQIWSNVSLMQGETKM